MIICWQLHPGDHTPAPHHCYGHRLNLHGTGWAGLDWAGLGWTRKVKCVAQSGRGWRMGGWGDSAICGLGILLTWNFIVFTCIFPNTKQNSWAKPLFPRYQHTQSFDRQPFLGILRRLLAGNLFWAKMSFFTLGSCRPPYLPNAYFCSRHARGIMTTASCGENVEMCGYTEITIAPADCPLHSHKSMGSN